MKHIFSISILVAMFLMGCAKGNNSNVQQQPIAYPPPIIASDCVSNPQYCQSGYYNNQINPGYYPYQYNTNGPIYTNNTYVGQGSTPFHLINNSNYLCNCPFGTIPTYNSYSGLGCVSQSYVNPSFGVYAYYGYGTGSTNNNQWVNIPQISNYEGYTQSGCYNGVVQSCLTNQQSSCGAGYTCRAQNAASAIGLCISTTNTTGTGTIFR